MTGQRTTRQQLSPLVDTLLRLPQQQQIVGETRFSVDRLPFLADHRVFGQVVSPGAGQLAMVLEVIQQASPEQAYQCTDVLLPQALVLPDETERTVQVILNTAAASTGDQAIPFELISFETGQTQASVQTHASGTLVPMTAPIAAEDLAALQDICTTSVDLARLDAVARAQQIEFGPQFRWLAAVWCDTDMVLGRLELPEATDPFTSLHPGLLDACLQLTVAWRASAQEEPASGETLLPFALDELVVSGAISGREWWCYAQRAADERWHIRLLDSEGKVLLRITGFMLRAAPRHAVLGTEVWRDWLYEVDWEPQPRFGQEPLYLPEVGVLSQTLARSGADRLQASAVQQQMAAVRQLSGLCVDYILAAFAETGVELVAGTTWKSTQLVRQMGVIPMYRRLLERLLGLLSEAGIVALQGDVWQVLVTPECQSPAVVRERLQTTCGEWIGAELNLLVPCAEQLGSVLRGTCDPLELLFPEGDSTRVNRIYQDSPIAETMNQVVCEAVEQVLAGRPAGQGIRILEIGAGTGGTTSGILPLLPADQTRYMFTDLGSGFFTAAREKFADYPFVAYQKLDIEQSPTEQGFALSSWDIVIAANVLHATRDLGTTLSHVQQLLQPNGVLLLLEATHAQGWADLTFGLTEGWWRFADQRKDHPLLSVAAWETLLLQHGFAAAVPVLNAAAPQNVLLAQVSATERPPLDSGRTWLLLADQQGLGTALADQLTRRGEHPVLVYPGEAWAAPSDPAQAIWQIRPDQPTDYERILAELPPIQGVVQLWSLDSPAELNTQTLEKGLREICSTTLHLIQSLLQQDMAHDLWLITRNTQAVVAEDTIDGLAQAALWGLSRTMVLEHPDNHCQCVDLAGDIPLTEQAAALSAILAGDGLLQTDLLHAPQKDQVALRHHTPYVARLARHTPIEQSAEVLAVRADATYLITGGLGGLGLQVSRWLVDHGARHLLLLGRRPPTSSAQACLDDMRAAGAAITQIQADVSREEDLIRALTAVSSDRPLRGVIHSAGVLDDGALFQQSWEQFSRVLAPKVSGAWHLHALTKDLDMDFFVLFSSGSGLLGNPGQSNHAAANTFLDALAHYRRVHQLPALSISWGHWSEIGAAAAIVQREGARIAEHGKGEINPEQGIQSFACLLKSSLSSGSTTKPHVGVMPVNWQKFLQTEQAKNPFFTRFEHQHQSIVSETLSDRSDWKTRLARIEAGERKTQLRLYLNEQVVRVLGYSASHEIPDDQLWVELGVDSLMNIEIKNKIAHDLAITVPINVLMDTSVEKLTTWLSTVWSLREMEDSEESASELSEELIL